MQLKKPELEKKIVSTLSTMVFNISAQNSVGFFDSNRAVQDFFAHYFNITNGYDSLVDLDIVHDTTSFPAVDIGDEKNKVAFQITSRTDKDKVSSTLEVFLDKNMHLTYPKLIVCMLGKRDNFKDDFNLGGVIDFTVEENVWDIPYLVKQIPKLSIDQLSELDNYMTKYLHSTTANTLIDADIKEAIELLDDNIYRVIDKLDATYSQIRIPNRSPHYIDAKNQLNNLTWDDFKVIQGHLMHGEKIVSFLSSPINDDETTKYLTAANAMQAHYSEHRSEYANIDVFMRYIFSLLDTYESTLDSNKIKILIHNMYFNCDIGENPA